MTRMVYDCEDEEEESQVYERIGRRRRRGVGGEREEDIRELIPKEPVPEQKLPLYHSKYSLAVRDEVQRRKECHRTMGYAEVHLEPPNNFLKKRTRIVKRPHIDIVKISTDKKEPVPSCKTRTSKDAKSGAKNYKKHNVVQVMRSVPRKPTPAFADTTKGNVQHLLPSGLLPQYIYKEGYGKIPNYLLMRQKVAEEKEKAIMRQEMKKKPPLRYITEDERQELLDGLKSNWQDLQKEFQLLPMVTDTVPKIKRKSQLEKELKELEKDIELIERNPIIYINENDRNKNKFRAGAGNAVHARG